MFEDHRERGSRDGGAAGVDRWAVGQSIALQEYAVGLEPAAYSRVLVSGSDPAIRAPGLVHDLCEYAVQTSINVCLH